MSDDLFQKAADLTRAYAKRHLAHYADGRARSWFGCVDMTCGALDCPHCFPGCDRKPVIDDDTDHRQDEDDYWDAKDARR